MQMNNQSNFLSTDMSAQARSECPWHAYCDGAFSTKCSEGVAVGIVIFDNIGNKYQYSKFRISPVLSSIRSVGAEICAAYLATKLARNLGCNKLVIHHDYLGVANWLNGCWDAHTEPSRIYVEEMRKYMEQFEISFKYVKGHSGNLWNERADRLATSALQQRIKENYEYMKG